MLSDTLSVYKQLIIEHPAMISVSPNSHRMKICAVPALAQGQKISPDHSDAVLVSIQNGGDIAAGSLSGIVQIALTPLSMCVVTVLF